MGYSYDQTGRLCCDNCGRSGGVRKIRCPFGWCPAPAYCPECRQLMREYLTKEYHRKNGCEEQSMEFARRHQEQLKLLQQGQLVRSSALGHNGRVKVLFAGLTGEKEAYWMSAKTYRAIPLLANATVTHYRRIGRVIKAKSLDLYDPA